MAQHSRPTHCAEPLEGSPLATLVEPEVAAHAVVALYLGLEMLAHLDGDRTARRLHSSTGPDCSQAWCKRSGSRRRRRDAIADRPLCIPPTRQDHDPEEAP